MCLQLYKEIEIYPKSTKVVQFDKAEFCNNGYGMLISDNSSQFLTHPWILFQIDFLMDFI